MLSFLILWMKSTRDVEALRMAEVEEAMDSSSASLSYAFVVVVGHVAESVGVVRVCDGRGRGRGSMREEKEGASVKVRVSVDLRKRV